MFELPQHPRDPIKEEPFEKLYVPEALLQQVESDQDSGICRLCPEGSRLQSLLFTHIQDEHPENGKPYKSSTIRKSF